MVLFEICLVKCVVLNEFFFVRNSYFKKFYIRVKFMIVFIECVDVFFIIIDIVVVFFSNIWVFFGGKRRKGF